jgi:hypothetical protein
MKSAEVQQLEVLSDLFADAVGFCRPDSVAILGVAGGNGLDRVDANITKRVVGLDINPSYLEAVRRRNSQIRVERKMCIMGGFEVPAGNSGLEAIDESIAPGPALFAVVVACAAWR